MMTALAAALADFYRTLVQGGVPEPVASELTLALGRQLMTNVTISTRQ